MPLAARLRGCAGLRAAIPSVHWRRRRRATSASKARTFRSRSSMGEGWSEQTAATSMDQAGQPRAAGFVRPDQIRPSDPASTAAAPPCARSPPRGPWPSPYTATVQARLPVMKPARRKPRVRHRLQLAVRDQPDSVGAATRSAPAAEGGSALLGDGQWPEVRNEFRPA